MFQTDPIYGHVLNSHHPVVREWRLVQTAVLLLLVALAALALWP